MGRVLASSNRMFCWTPLKHQHSNPKPNPGLLANTLWCSDFLTPLRPLIISYRLPAFFESLMPLKNWCSIHARWSKSSLKYSIRFCGFFLSLKQNIFAYRSSKVSSRADCIFELHQLWQSGLSRLYSNCCSSCSFEPDIIRIGQSSHNMYSNNILNCQESTTILNAHTKKVWKLIVCTLYSFLIFFFFHLPFFDNVRIEYSQELVVFLFSEHSDAFPICPFNSFLFSLFLFFFFFFVINMAHFSMQNSIPTSCPNILIILFRYSNSLFFANTFKSSLNKKWINLFLRFCEFVPPTS